MRSSRLPHLRLLPLLALAACGGGALPSNAKPRLLVDGKATVAIIDARSSRSGAFVAVSSAKDTTVFGQALVGLHVDLDLSSVPNNEPGRYDLWAVAACSRDEAVGVDLVGAQLTEGTGSTQASWNQLLADGCDLSSAGSSYRLTGQTNISTLDDAHVELSVNFKLDGPAEGHEFQVDRLNLKF